MFIDLCTQDDNDATASTELLQSKKNPTYEWDIDFGPYPSSICGSSKKRSDNLNIGIFVSSRKCMCGFSVITGESESKRFYLHCSKNKCKFFRWADQVLDPPFYNLAHTRVEWKELSAPVYSLLPRDGFTTPFECIIQGSLGDCWFLSALAVLCENERLLNKVVLGEQSPKCCQFRFCVSGVWDTVSVDKYVPVFISGHSHGTEAFARPYKNVSLGPLIEKAYAKAYGSYTALHGGHISEALFDLTGCPVETIDISEDDGDLWVRLKSFEDNGFLMGAGTVSSENGLVSMHAYSILDFVELHNVQVGRQALISEFLNSKSEASVQTTTLRLVQIRNPWGRKEWTGNWSGNSDKWTQKIINEVPNYISKKGIFWMEFEDFKNAFSQIDVAKTHPNWVETEFRNVNVIDLHSLFVNTNQRRIKISSLQNQWTYISIVQPSVRGTAKKQYSDIHLILVNSKDGSVQAVRLGEMERVLTMETLLMGQADYELIIFSCQGLIKTVAVKIFSSGPVMTSMFNSNEPLPSSLFEQIIAQSLNVRDVIDVTKNAFIQIHSNKCLTGFVLTSQKESDIGVQVIMQINDYRLKAFGKWRTNLANVGSTLLGIIAGEPKSTYSYEIRVSGATNDAHDTRNRSHTNPASEIISID